MNKQCMYYFAFFVEDLTPYIRFCNNKILHTILFILHLIIFIYDFTNIRFYILYRPEFYIFFSDWTYFLCDLVYYTIFYFLDRVNLKKKFLLLAYIYFTVTYFFMQRINSLQFYEPCFHMTVNFLYYKYQFYSQPHKFSKLDGLTVYSVFLMY